MKGLLTSILTVLTFTGLQAQPLPSTPKLLFVALLLFVGIPLPGTGAWTGTLAASFLDMGFKKSVIAVLLGVLLAGVIMGIASAGVFTAIFSFA